MAILKPYTDGWSIVIRGHWNRNIFCPAWISSRLTTAKEIGIEVPVDNPGLPIRLTFDGIRLSVMSNKLILTMDRPEDNLLEKCRDVSIKALQELPHTPIMAVGINYLFIAEQPDDSLLRIFHLKDNDNLSDIGIKIQTTTIQRKLHIQDQTINLSLSLLEDSKVHVAFNFHQDTPNTKQAVEFLNAHSTDLKEKTFELLSRVYNSTVEQVY